MRGAPPLSPRHDEVIAQWAITDPSLKAWADDTAPRHTYASGSAGPDAADALIAPHRWRGL